MRPAKAILFLFYCLAGIFAVGASFSHLWRVRKEAAAESRWARTLAAQTSSQPALEALH